MQAIVACYICVWIGHFVQQMITVQTNYTNIRGSLMRQMDKVRKAWLLPALIAATLFGATPVLAEDDEMVLHFGYGSNMSEEFMKQYTPSLKYLMNARLPNFEIQFRKYSENMQGGISSIIDKPGGMVYGVLYYIPKKEIEELDILEDVPLGIYTRETFQVLGDDGNWYAGDLYRVAEPKGPYEPAKQYLDLMITGGKEHGINPEWIAKLEAMRAKQD